MKRLHDKFKKLTQKSGKIDTSKIKDNRARIIIKNTCELPFITSFKQQVSRSDMMLNITEKELQHSNLVIVINIHENNINTISDFLSNKVNLKTEMTKSDDEYILIVGGTITDYKDMIRNIFDLNNSVCQLIFDCLYQLDKSLFTDFIKDDIMKEDMFVFETEIEQLEKIENSDIVHIDNIMDLYSAVEGKIQLRRLMKFINVTRIYTTTMNKLVGLTRYTYKYNNTFTSDVLDMKNTVNWAGNSWTLSSLGNLLYDISLYMDEIPDNIKELYKPLGTSVSVCVTDSLDKLINTDKYIDQYLINNFGEDFDINNLKLPEYKQKVISNDEIQYIDEVVNEEIMSTEEYMQLYLEQEDKDEIIESEEETEQQ